MNKKQEQTLADFGLTKEDIELSPFDVADYLTTDEDIRLFLEAAAEEGTEEEFAHALQTAARAKGINQIVKECGLTREKLTHPGRFMAEIKEAFKLNVCKETSPQLA